MSARPICRGCGAERWLGQPHRLQCPNDAESRAHELLDDCRGGYRRRGERDSHPGKRDPNKKPKQKLARV